MELKSIFTARQLRSMVDGIRVRDVISTGRAHVNFRGLDYVVTYGVKTRTVRSVVAY